MILRRAMALAALTLLASSLAAQEPPEQADMYLNPDAPQNCEMNIVSMEVLAMLTARQTKDGGVLIAVARLGEGERSREFSRRRLYNVREFLKDRGGVREEKIVVAEGEPARGFGRVEFYLGGRKVGALLLARNKDLCLICCDKDGPYYPHKDNSDDIDKGARRKRAGARR